LRGRDAVADGGGLGAPGAVFFRFSSLEEDSKDPEEVRGGVLYSTVPVTEIPDRIFTPRMNFAVANSGQLTAVVREIRRSGLFFFEVDSAFLKKESAGCVHRVRTRLCNFYGKRSRPRKKSPPNVGFGVGPLPSEKHK
jgi:hypothetical protein